MKRMIRIEEPIIEVLQEHDPVPREWLKEMAKARRRFGYPGPHVFLRSEGPARSYSARPARWPPRSFTGYEY